MNREAVLNQLSNPDRTHELYVRMKRLPSDNPAFLSLHQWMTQINAFRSLRGIKQKNIIQNIISFAPLRSTWISHRLVCKDWRCAIESMRFDASIEDFRPILEDSDEEIESEYDIVNVVKFPGAFLLLTRLTKLDLEIHRLPELDAEDEQTLIEVAKNLKQIRFYDWDHEHDDNEWVGNIISKILSQSQRTLTNLELSSRFLPCALPNLKFLKVDIDKYSVKDVANLLNTLDLDHVQQIRFLGVSKIVANFLEQKYAQYCCSSRELSVLSNASTLPVRAIMTLSLNIIMEIKYPECVEYIFAGIMLDNRTKEFEYGWDQPNLSNFPNLKEIYAKFCCFSYRANENILEEKKRVLKELVSTLGIKLIEVKSMDHFDCTFAKEIPFNGCRFIF